MLKNYLLIAWRNIKRDRFHAFINIAGLAVGIASCLIILLSVRYELSFDRFHEKGDRIYRIGLERGQPDRVRYWGWNTPRVSEAMAADYPEVAKRVRILTETGPTQLRRGNTGMVEKKVLYVDPEFFEIFTIPVVRGDVRTFLRDPSSILLTPEAARRYFGSEDPIGKVLNVRNWLEEDKPHVVAGVIGDLPSNSHFHYDFLLPLASTRVIEFGWGSWYCFNYVLLREGADGKALEAKLPGLVDRYLPSLFEGGEAEFRRRLAEGNSYRYFLQPLFDIHLKSRLEHELAPVGNIAYVVLFSVIAGFILVLACVNFINLSTARSARRSREVGVRKVLGSFHRQLVGQFLSESILVTVLATGAACCLTALALPLVGSLTGADFRVWPLDYALAVPGLLAFALLIGAIAGAYPAFFLSSFEPASVLKSGGGKVMARRRLRNALVVFQFAVSIALIAGTLFVRKQVDFLLEKDLGYDKENLLVIENAQALGKQFEAFKAELKNDPAVAAAAGGGFPGSATHTFNGQVRGVPSAPSVPLYNTGGDHDYLDTLGISVVAGRKFQRGDRIDREHPDLMLNESAVRALKLDDPIGKELVVMGGRGAKIVAVIKDFHFRSLHRDIAPYAFMPINTEENAPACAVVRIRPGRLAEATPRIRDVWRRFTGGLEFQSSVLEDTLSGWYASEKKVAGISGVFSSLAVLIGCLGLFGLAAFTMEHRSREIGIRKVLGASVPGLTSAYLMEFLKLVGLAFALSIPAAYVVMSRWLNGFAYHIRPEAGTFLLAGGLTIAVALLTVAFHVIRAALADPVRSLRYE